ncbi:MAG: hypothetical protein OET79_14980, partial [Nitrospirota bacterium]|nr:hypothetical protein [Nitrospirota bacterium]
EKLQTWGSHIDPRAVPGNTPEQVQALVTSLQALAYRIKELVEAREYPQADLLVRELLEDVRGWRIAIERLFQHWATDPASEPGDDLEARLQTRLAKLEARIEETLGLAEQGQLSDKDYENFYRLLGAFRGLSEAVVEHARLAADIRWARWQEARF